MHGSYQENELATTGWSLKAISRFKNSQVRQKFHRSTECGYSEEKGPPGFRLLPPLRKLQTESMAQDSPPLLQVRIYSTTVLVYVF